MNKKIYACYSPSHKPLLEQHFLPSIPKGFDVVLRKVDQNCASGEYKSAGWGEAVREKSLLILEAIDHEREPFVFSDVDIRFYNFKPENLIEDMKGGPNGDWDIRCQPDDTVLCTGFMFIRPCQSTRWLFQLVMDYIHQCNDDQTAFNEFALPHLRRRGAKIDISALSRDRYWNTGPEWNGNGPVTDIAIHHGNWSVGIDNKMRLLNDILNFKTAKAQGER